MNEDKLNELYEFMTNLKASTRIPLEVDRAFRERLGLSGIPLVNLSNTKNADSEDQAVDEGSTGTYNVLKEPIGFLPITVGSTTYYVPYFNA